MKVRSFIWGAVFLTIFICVIGWLLWSPTSPQPEKQPVTAKPAAIDSVAKPRLVASPKLAQPVLAPVVVPANTVESIKTQPAQSDPFGLSPATGNEDPQANLITAFADMKRLIRAGEMVKFYQTYSWPGHFTEEDARNLQAIQDKLKVTPNPEEFKRREAFARIIEDMESQTPVFNDAGDQATYTYTLLPPPGSDEPGPTATATMIKIDGKWYIK
jgi:hypothetical protein